MLFLLFTAAFAAQSVWRTECNTVAKASWANVDKAAFGKAFFKNWMASEPEVADIFKKSSFPQGPAQFLVERFDILLDVMDDENALAKELQVVAKTHMDKGVEPDTLVTFQDSFLKTLPAFDSEWTRDRSESWAYVLSHVITTPLISMASPISSFLGTRKVRKTWNGIDKSAFCGELTNILFEDESVKAYFQGISKDKQVQLICAFTQTVMDGLTLPGDDTEKRNSNMKQLASFHAGMGVGATEFLTFERAMYTAYKNVMGSSWGGPTQYAHTYVLHNQVFDKLVRYNLKWQHASWKANVRKAQAACSA
jgi:hemoglobin-like flavoprotein